MESAESRMSWRRTASRRIHDAGARENLVTEPRPETLLGNQIYVATEKILHVVLQADQMEQADAHVGPEGHEEVDVAVLAEILAQVGTEHGQLLDLELLAQLTDLLFGHRGSIATGHGLDPSDNRDPRPGQAGCPQAADSARRCPDEPPAARGSESLVRLFDPAPGGLGHARVARHDAHALEPGQGEAAPAAEL